MIVRSYNPIWSLVDLNGQQLDDTYYLFTLQNTLPYLPSPIWRDAGQINQWPVPIQFLANGTLPNNMYWDDEQTYRLEIRRGNTQADPLIYLIENYQPDTSQTPEPGTSSNNTTNQITNPQFASLNFTGTLTISTATSVEIGPGWFIETSGAGTLTVTQVQYAGNTFSPSNATNAATGLRLVNNGFSLVQLKQRFNGNGALWTGAESPQALGPGVAVNLTASATTPILLEAWVEYSNGAQNTQVISQTLTTTNTDYSNAAIISESSNTDLPDVAYTDFAIKFTDNSTVDITSVQLIGQQEVEQVPYFQITPQRQVDQEFNYYSDPLQRKPIASMLTGWDFPLNPAQPHGTSMNIEIAPTAANCYIWDQLISKSVAGNVAVARNAVTGGIQCTTANNNEAFYFLQYLSGNQAKEILGTRLSVNINAWRTQAGGDVTVHAYLYRGSSAASIPTLPTIIGTTNANGIFTLTAANWTEIARSNFGTAVGTLSTVRTTNYEDLNDVVDLSFSGWEITSGAEIADTDKFAIVVTFSCPTAGTVVVVDSISCVKGDIPTRPAPQTFDEVLRECQYYYETSKNVGVTITTSSGSGALLRQMESFQQAANIVAMWPRSFGIEYNVVKRTAPITSIYSEGGASGNVTAFTYQGGAQIATSAIALLSAWTAANGGQKGIEYLATYTDTATGLIPISIFTLNNTTHSFISFHYEADARLGIV